VEIEVVWGALVGEIGIFSPDHRRTGIALCETEIEIEPIGDEKALQLSTTRTRVWIRTTHLRGRPLGHANPTTTLRHYAR
jgi:hypothetical protein